MPHQPASALVQRGRPVFVTALLALVLAACDYAERKAARADADRVAAEVEIARSDLKEIQNAVFRFNLDVGGAPADVAELIEARLLRPTQARDPWHQDYVIELRDAGSEWEVAIFSTGPDREKGTADDVYAR